MMRFKQSPVIFDEDNHRYYLDGKRLSGITGLIHSILGLGVYPEANEYAKDVLIPRAGSRGTAVHHAIQTYDQLGMRETVQTVRTRYGCEERNNISYKDEVWEVGYELDCYINHLDLYGFEPLANELTVSDNDKYASQIDNVWRHRQTDTIWLVDTKTNNISLYPTCGYFNPNYFTSGEDALKEYLSWQLSIYAVLFEAENPGMKVGGVACNWLRKDADAFWFIERKPDSLVKELLTTDYMFLDNEPVYFHHNPEIFGIMPGMPVVKQETVPVVPPDVVTYVAYLLREEKETKAKLDEAKKALRAAMEQHKVKSCDLGIFRATIAADSTRATFDSSRFKKENPDLYNKYLTTKTTKGGFTVKLKGQ